MGTDFNNMSDRELLLNIAARMNSLEDQWLSDRIEDNTVDISDLNLRVEALELRDNHVEQRDRNYASRLVNFELPNDLTSARQASYYIYKKFVQPALKKAVDKEPDLHDHVPTFWEVWDMGHAVPTRDRPDGTPGPNLFTFSFTSRGYLQLYLENIKEVLQDHNDANPDKPEVKTKKDMTSANKACMSTLYDNSEVENFWLSGTTIKYTKTGDPDRSYTVSNPFGRDLAEMHQRPTDVSKIQKRFADRKKVGGGNFAERTKQGPARRDQRDVRDQRDPRDQRENRRGGGGGGNRRRDDNRRDDSRFDDDYDVIGGRRQQRRDDRTYYEDDYYRPRGGGGGGGGGGGYNRGRGRGRGAGGGGRGRARILN